MKIYAETPHLKVAQLLRDAAVVTWIVVWVRVSMWIYELVEKLGAPGKSIESAGRSFASTVEDAGGEVGDLPVIGDDLQAPFETIADAGRFMQSAGQAQQDAVHTLALWLAVVIGVLAISYVVYRYLPERIAWVREASAADRLRIDADDLHLFALRAVATQPLYELRRAVADPAAALARGEYEPLAALELARLGLALPRGGRSGAA